MEVVITPEKATLGLNAYLVLKHLLNDGYVSWDNAKELSGTRTANAITEIRKAIQYTDIVNIHIPTMYSYYDRYRIAHTPESKERAKKLFNHIANKPRVQKDLMRINPEWLEKQLELSKRKIKKDEGQESRN